MPRPNCFETPRFNRNSFILFLTLAAITLAGGVPAFGAVADRITRAVNPAQTRALTGNIHPLAQAQYDGGAVDPALRLSHVLLMFGRTTEQQAELEQLLAAQQNPSSPEFHKWLTPEEFGNRFGISPADRSKVVAWLTSAGFSIDDSARAGNWVAFSGNAASVGRALRTSIHRFNVNGESHFANISVPAVPEALAGVVAGILGLNDFVPKPNAVRFRPIGSDPDYNRGTAHFLVPEDFSTIYNLGPLQKAGIDGTGQAIVVVGQSAISLADVRAFRTRYGLPTNDPRLLPYASDPGFNGAEIEGDLDVEWAGALAPKAIIFYVYGASVSSAVIAAVNANLAPIITYSYGACEIDISDANLYRAIWQQGNAQGITLVASSGDSGPACDLQGIRPFATVGKTVSFPADIPETTAVGGTKFNEGSGAYWSDVNTATFGSALSYIPEVAWNESDANGLGASGGGPSTRFAKPTWQTGPGVPNDGARDVPDISFSAAGHDAYFITFQGLIGGVGGTSASAPSFAGVLALLNQYQISKGFQRTPGLGNINPQLYRLAQVAPTVFHDVTEGNNFVPCAQGSPDCLTGSYGYSAGPGYDMVTGLGSVDVNRFVTQWNQPANPVLVTMSTNASTYTLNDTIAVTAVVSPTGGTGVPTGSVDFIGSGGTVLGSARLALRADVQAADFNFPAWAIGTGTTTLRAVYGGDVAFSGGAASVRTQVSSPVGASGILPVVNPTTIHASPVDAQGSVWQTSVTLRELNGIPSVLTGFAIDGKSQPLPQYFPATSIPARSSLTSLLSFRNVDAPVTKVFSFTGVDAGGKTWARDVSVTFTTTFQRLPNFLLTAAPLTMERNPSASPACQWSQQLSLDETGGFQYGISRLFAGNQEISDRIPAIFGTDRLAAWGSVQGTLCWSDVAVPATNDLYIQLQDEFGRTLSQDVIVSFAPPAASPPPLAVSPSSVRISSGDSVALPVLSVNPGSTTRTWTASVFPANRTTSWLSLSRYSGTGAASVTLQASADGFEPGAYRATIQLQANGTVPQVVSVPVLFVIGTQTGIAISSAGSGLSFQPNASPGMIMTVFGTGLANSVRSATTQPLPYALEGVSAVVNGIAAPLFYTSPGQLNIQIPYEAGAGPAVLGVNNNGLVAGYSFRISPAAPAILADDSGRLLPAASAASGANAVLYLSGAGMMTPALRTGFAPSSTTPAASLPKVRLPLAVTVGGLQAFLQFAGMTPGVIGLAQVNFVVPSSLPPGPQPVVVTVNGVASPPVTMNITAP